MTSCAHQDELILDAFRSGADTMQLSAMFDRPEPLIVAAIDRARQAEYDRKDFAARSTRQHEQAGV